MKQVIGLKPGAKKSGGIMDDENSEDEYDEMASGKRSDAEAD